MFFVLAWLVAYRREQIAKFLGGFSLNKNILRCGDDNNDIVILLNIYIYLKYNQHLILSVLVSRVVSLERDLLLH